MRGITSLDVIFALIIATFMFSWLQGFARTGISEADAFGSQMSVQAAAIDAGSRMNAFFAWNPGANDYIVLSKQLRFFNASLPAGITKDNNAWNTTVGVIRTGTNYSETYPVAADVIYSPATKKATT